MGRQSSVRGDFLHVKTAMGLKRFEDGNSLTAMTSLSDVTFLNFEKRDSVHVKIIIGLERFEVAKNSSATTSLSDLTILSFEKNSIRAL